MNAMWAHDDHGNPVRYYLNGRRVSKTEWETAHFGRDIDSLSTRRVVRRGRAMTHHMHVIRVPHIAAQYKRVAYGSDASHGE